jgi:hypothetical protein
MNIDSSLPAPLVSFGIQGLNAATLSGLSLPREPTFSCASGNCTWPAFDTLGICSSCTDVSKSAKKACYADREQNGLRWQHCDYTIGADLTITMAAVLDEAFGTLLNSTSITLRVSGGAVLAHIGILRIDGNEYRQSHEAAEDVPTSIYDCELTWCLKKYGSAYVENGVLEEPVHIQSAALTEVGTGGFEAEMMTCTEFPLAPSLTYFVLQDLDEPPTQQEDDAQYAQLRGRCANVQTS